MGGIGKRDAALFQSSPQIEFERSTQCCHNAMKFGVVNKSTTLNRFVVLQTLQRNITHLAIITRKTNIKLGILKKGNWKRALIAIKFDPEYTYFIYIFQKQNLKSCSQFRIESEGGIQLLTKMVTLKQNHNFL